MAAITDHEAELGDQPVFWRSAPAPEAESELAPVLYLHGAATSSDAWLALLERSGGIAPDLLGFGRSGKRGDLDFSLDGLAAFVEAFLALTGTERVRLVGHDWGAAIGLSWALRDPTRVERVVVASGAPLGHGVRWPAIARAWRMPIVGELAVGVTTRRVLRRTLPAPLADGAFTHFDQGTQRALLRLHRGDAPAALERLRGELGRIDADALLVWGERDRLTPVAVAEAYAGALGGPTELVRVPDAGHWPWYDRPDVVDRIAAFLAA